MSRSRSRWWLALTGAASAAGVFVAVSVGQVPPITITDLEARAAGAEVTSGPNGTGFDIFIAVTVNSGTWESTRWSVGTNTGCRDTADRGIGSSTADLTYAYQANPALREEPLLADPEGAGDREHVFAAPPGGTLTVDVFANDTCSGAPLATRSIALTTPAPAANPPLVAACTTLQVAVILDESGSIQSAGATQQVRNATNALAQGLVDTGASMAVFKFSTNASGSTIPPYQTVTPGFISGQLATYLAAYNPNGFTNWDDGLEAMRTATAADPPDLVIFLTDGNPNRSDTAGTGTSEGFYTAMVPAVAEADAIKGIGSHTFVIGVGAGVTDPLSQRRLVAMSGPNPFPAFPINTADHTFITDFNQLEEALRRIASNLCDVTLTVTKETDEATPGTFAPRPGWTFSGTVSIQQPPGDPLAYGWREPTVDDPPPATATQSGITSAAGSLRFVWRPVNPAATSSITVTETVQPGLVPESVTCTSGGAPVPVTGTATSFTVSGMAVRASVACVVRNQVARSTVQVVKNYVGAPSPTTIFVDANGAAPFDAETAATASGASASFSYPTSTPATVGETSVPTGYTATIACGTAAPQPYSGGPFSVTSPATAGTTLTCTIVNTATPPPTSTVQVVKNYVGAPSPTTIFVDANGAAPFDAETAATASGASASFSYPTSTPATVGETSVPTGYTATIDCGPGPQPYTGGPFAVTAPAVAGATLTCTITNASAPVPPVLSTVQVVKNFVGDPSPTTIFVDADGAAPFDASTSAAASGASTSFTYPLSTNVTVGETAVPTGYTATIDCGTGPVAYAGGPFAVTSPATAGATLTCTITNTAPAPPTPTPPTPTPPTPTPPTPTPPTPTPPTPTPPTPTPPTPTPPTPPRPPAPRPPIVTPDKDANRNRVQGGETVRFTITIRAGRGNVAARNVTVCDVLPEGLAFMRAPGARFVRGNACWTVRRLAPRTTRQFVVVARANTVSRPTLVTNVACVESENTSGARRLAGASQRRNCSARAPVRVLGGKARPGGVTG